MKKNKLILTLSLVTLFALTGCNKGDTSKEQNSSEKNPTSEVQTVDKQEILDAAMNGLTVPQEVSADFNLTVNAVGGVKITWTSSDPAITINGNMAKVTRSRDGDVNVTLTAVGKLNDQESEPKTFTVKVLQLVIDEQEDAITVKEAKDSEVGTTVKVYGVVSAIVGGVSKSSGDYSASGFYLSDETETIYVYGYMTANKVKRGDYVCISGKIEVYSEGIQIASPELVDDTIISENNPVPNPDGYAITGKTIEEVYNPSTFTGAINNTYVFDCYITKYPESGTTYQNYEIISSLSGGKYMNIYSQASDLKCPENAWLDQYVESKQQVKVAYYINSTNSKKTSYRGNIIYIYEA